jgi:hypothetical protein
MGRPRTVSGAKCNTRRTCSESEAAQFLQTVNEIARQYRQS